jgi:photosystem II stability/assembly factor-like uncharacterized protein
MATSKISQIQFMDGAAVEDVVRIFIAGDLQSGNYNFSRLFYLRDSGEWGHFDVETIVVSVCVVAKPRRIYFALGRDGLVWVGESGGGQPFIERIPDAGTVKGKYGYLSQIRDIANDVYVCGDGGQVYRRTSNGWIHIDDGILEKRSRPRSNCHNGIDGTGPNDIYVVGEYGRIFHFDGKKWKQVGFQTNLHLERVRCVNRDEVYICGAGGLLLRGNRSGWEAIGDSDMTDHIWDLEVFNGNIYLAVEDTLMVYDGKGIASVETKLDPPIDAHRLSAHNGILWSFGEDDLAYYDGKKWTRVVHPDNV